MGLRKVIKCLNWGYNELLTSIVTFFVTLVTTSHEPLSRAEPMIVRVESLTSVETWILAH